MRVNPFILFVVVALAAMPSQNAIAQPRAASDPVAQAADPSATSKALSAEADVISLPELLDVAVRTSPDLALARIDVDIAEARILAASGIDDWLLAAVGSWASLRADPIAGNPVQTTEQDIASIDLSMSRSLAWGGLFEVSASGSHIDTTSLVEVTPDSGNFTSFDSTNYTTDFTLQYTQSLLRGRGSAVARAEQAQVRIAKTAAELSQESATINVVRDLITAYWDLALAYRELAIAESSLALAQEQLRITQAKVRAGAVAPSEALAVQQSIATQRAAIVSSRYGILNRSLDLRRLAGLEIKPDHFVLAPKASIEPVTSAHELAPVIERALASSPEIAILKAQDKGAAIEVAVTENGLLPQLDLSVYFGPSGRGETIGDAVDQIATLSEYSFGGSLTFRQNLGHNTAEGQLLEAHANRRKVKINMVDAQRQVTAAAARAVALADSARERMQIGEVAIDLAEKNIVAEKARFELGRSTNFDVLRRQEELKQAQLNHARAAIDYLSAVAQIQSLTGELLPQYGITVGEKPAS